MPTLDEIRAMGIVEARKLPIEELIKAVYEGETYTANQYRIEDEYHNAIDQGYEVRNAYDGNLLSKHRIQWTYYEPAKEGRVRDIDVQGGNLVKRICHTPEGSVEKVVEFLEHQEPIREIGEAGDEAVSASGIMGLVNRLLGRE